MLFGNILQEKSNRLSPEFDKLFKDILTNQTHEGDLLLTRVNGFYYPEIEKWTNIKNKNPYMFGVGEDGHSDNTHYKFINNYRTNSVSKLSYPEYLKMIEWSETKEKEIDEIINQEDLVVQLQMLIYLKIWETDLFIKRFYQFALLTNGKDYDWHFKISESNRSKNCTGKRDEIIRLLVRDKLQTNYPEIYSAIKNAFKTQVRNSIAHSQYYTSARYINLTNYIENDDNCQIKTIKFDDWIDMFHDTMVIYNEMILFNLKIDDFYSRLVPFKGNPSIRVNMLHPAKKTIYQRLKYRIQFSDWVAE